MAAVYTANLYPKPTEGQTDERLTVSSTVVISATNWKTNTLNRFVVLDIQTNDVMVTFDGSDPSATNGHRLYAGQSYTWAVDTVAKARFIRQSADAAIQFSGFTY